MSTNKMYYQVLKDEFFKALETIKVSQHVKAFAIRCMDAGNEDDLVILGNQKSQVYYRFTYEDIKVFRTKQEHIDQYFAELSEWADDDAKDVFIHEWWTVEEFVTKLEHSISVYQEGNIDEDMDYNDQDHLF